MKNDQLIKLAQGLIGKKVSIARNSDILAKGEIEGLYGIPEGL
jgi:flagellar motor switch/type III secretory pathway protein FliN